KKTFINNINKLKIIVIPKNIPKATNTSIKKLCEYVSNIDSSPAKPLPKKGFSFINLKLSSYILSRPHKYIPSFWLLTNQFNVLLSIPYKLIKLIILFSRFIRNMYPILNIIVKKNRCNTGL